MWKVMFIFSDISWCMCPILADHGSCLLWWDILESVWWANYQVSYTLAEMRTETFLYLGVWRLLDFIFTLCSGRVCVRKCWPLWTRKGIPESQVPEFRGWSKESKDLNWLHGKEKLGFSALFSPLPPLGTLKLYSIHSVNFAVLRRNDSAVTVTVGANRCAQDIMASPECTFLVWRKQGLAEVREIHSPHRTCCSMQIATGVCCQGKEGVELLIDSEITMVITILGLVQAKHSHEKWPLLASWAVVLQSKPSQPVTYRFAWVMLCYASLWK